MDDPLQRATLNVLSAVGPSAFFTDENLLNLTLCRTANISLKHGNDESSPLAYTYLGSILGPHFGDYETGYRLGKLGIDLVEQGLDRWKCRVFVCFGTLINPWSKHVRTSLDWIRTAFDAALKVGDIGYAGYCCQNLIPLLIANGTSLAEVQSEALNRLEFARRIKFGLVIDSLTGQLALIRQLRGLTLSFSSFDDGEFDEKAFERHLEENPLLAFPACWYWIRKLQARFYAGDHSAALDAAAKAEPLLWTSPSFFEIAEYHFFSALSHTAIYSRSDQSERQRRRKAIAAHQKQLAMWAKNCPANFDNRLALVTAEIARIEGRELEAERLYEQAIRSARENDFLHNEALAIEVAARFYATRGFEKIAHAYLRDARYCYLRWGAAGKVQQLDELYPQLKEEERFPGPTSTIRESVEHLDLATVIKVSQTVSGEIVLEKLIDTLMRTALEHAGAERGLLILSKGPKPRIEAEATTSGGAVVVRSGENVAAEAAFPESVIQYVLRTHDSVNLADASAPNAFSEDLFIPRNRARSILCLPLINQGKLTGVLYLENNLASNVFTRGRIAVLKLIASQAAISLENTLLYRDLQEREEALRRSQVYLTRAQRLSQTGSLYWKLSTGELGWSDESFRIMGYDRTVRPSLDLVFQRVHPEDLSLVEQTVDRAARDGSGFELEHRLLMPDGAVKHVHVVVEPVNPELNNREFVGTMMDITERKLAEEAVRKAQTELAHVSRVTTMGELAASIAHEVNQPLVGVVTNASAGLRYLGWDTPNLGEAKEAIRAIIRDGNRAADVVSRMRALFKKASPAKEVLNINEAIEEVVLLTQSEARRNKVLLRVELFRDLPSVMADRVQIQQVLMNLILNGIQAMNVVEDRERVLAVRSEPGEDDEIKVAVQDCGIGIDPDRLERIFDAFHTTKPGGMGMGLSISRSIVESHGGRLWVTPNDGPGVTFQFTL
jgi:PAS domain S-box-containing protein